jgi:hypothetical protein
MRLERLTATSTCLMQAPDPKSTRHSKQSLARNPERFWSIPIHFSPASTLRSRCSVRRSGCQRRVPQSWCLCRKDCSGHEASGLTDSPADQIRIGAESQDCSIDGAKHFGFVSVACRRGHRMIRLRAEMLPSSIAGLRVSSIGYRQWRPISSAAGRSHLIISRRQP